MNLDTFTRAQMARFAMEEGERHGGVANMMATACVLRNRVFAGWGSWIDVVQRAPEKRATVYPASGLIDWKSGNARTFLNRLDGVYTGEELDLTEGAQFYCEPRADLKLEQWFQDEVLGNPDEHPRVAHVGPVWFYR